LINVIFIDKLLIEFGDWGFGIGDCPISNLQSPIPNPQIFN